MADGNTESAASVTHDHPSEHAYQRRQDEDSHEKPHVSDGVGESEPQSVGAAPDTTGSSSSGSSRNANNANAQGEAASKRDEASQVPTAIASGGDVAHDESNRKACVNSSQRKGGLRRTTTALAAGVPNRSAAGRGGCEPTTAATEAAVLSSSSSPSLDSVSSAQLECLAAIAYMLGSPLQRTQPSPQEGAVQSSLLLACELLERGVDPERVIELVEARSGYR